MFTKKQNTLYVRLLGYGYDKFDAAHAVKFHPQLATDLLKGFRRKRRARCMEPGGCTAFVADHMKQFCEEHKGKRLLGMDVEDPTRPYHTVG